MSTGYLFGISSLRLTRERIKNCLYIYNNLIIFTGIVPTVSNMSLHLKLEQNQQQQQTGNQLNQINSLNQINQLNQYPLSSMAAAAAAAANLAHNQMSNHHHPLMSHHQHHHQQHQVCHFLHALSNITTLRAFHKLCNVNLDI